MRKNEKGFGIIGVLLIIDIVLLIAVGTLLVFVIQSSISNGPVVKQTSQNTADRKSSNRTNTAPEKVDTTIYDVNLRINTAADLLTLPDYIPTSFKAYFIGKLRNNEPVYNGETDVTTQWFITKISQVNIQGGAAPVGKDGNVYPGGAPLIWVLTPSETWDEESLNSAVCTSKNGGKVYVEFVSECATEYGNFSSWQKNPNGSILSINGR